MTAVVSIYGGPTGVPEVNEVLVAALEEWLEKARAGEVIGMATAFLHCDGLASYQVAGRVGGYSLLGALDVARLDVLEIVR